MAINFKITRLVEDEDNIGCNDFQTNQLAGDVAGLNSATDLDGDIIWYIDADPGYEVDNDKKDHTSGKTKYVLGVQLKPLGENVDNAQSSSAAVLEHQV